MTIWIGIKAVGGWDTAFFDMVDESFLSSSGDVMGHIVLLLRLFASRSAGVMGDLAEKKGLVGGMCRKVASTRMSETKVSQEMR